MPRRKDTDRDEAPAEDTTEAPPAEDTRDEGNQSAMAGRVNPEA
jgi:hypothetical protein